MFDIPAFKKKLNTRWLGSEFIYLEKTDSTNTRLKKIPGGELVHGTVLLADAQEKGRGQYERNWISEPARNLTFTIAFKPGTPDNLALLPVAAGWGIARALKKLTGVRFNLKWPNDLVIAGRKIGGILTENVFNGPDPERVLIGIGLNINQVRFPDDLENATSLALEFGNPACREEILCSILEHTELAYTRWEEREKKLIHDINRTLAGYGKWVRISVNGKTEREKVKFLGINHNGYLVILTPDLEVKTFTYEQIRIEPDR